MALDNSFDAPPSSQSETLFPLDKEALNPNPTGPVDRDLGWRFTINQDRTNKLSREGYLQ